MTTKKIVLIVVIIIVLSTAIIVTINLLKKKKIAEKNLRESKTGVDTTGMNDYVIMFPFVYREKLGDYYDAIINTGYSHVSETVVADKVGNQNVEIYIKALPKDIQNIATILYKLNKEIVVKEITKKP